MKVTLILVTYKNGKREEQLFDSLPKNDRKKIGQELTDKFMKRAGFMPIPG